MSELLIFQIIALAVVSCSQLVSRKEASLILVPVCIKSEGYKGEIQIPSVSAPNYILLE